VSLQHGTTMSGQKGVTVQNKQGWVYPGHNWPNEINENGVTRSGAFLVSQKSGKTYNLVQRSSMQFQGYNPFNSGLKGITT
jgi:hypothetical protein